MPCSSAWRQVVCCYYRQRLYTFEFFTLGGIDLGRKIQSGLTLGPARSRLVPIETQITPTKKEQGPMGEGGRHVIVDVQDVKVVYNANKKDTSTHVYALRGLTVQVYENEFFAIMGPSGSGKSTLFNAIGALQIPTSGKVLIDGVNLAELSPQQLAAVRCFELGYIFQTYNLLPVMSALMNVALPTIFAGMTTEEGE